jgi:integrase
MRAWTRTPDFATKELLSLLKALFLSKNAHPKILQEMLGHATITQTMDTYSHVMPGMSDIAATALEKVLG